MYQGVLLEFLNMGGGEIALIMVAILLLFGGKKLPELARGLGKGIREFKDASEGVKREIHRNINEATAAVDTDKEDEKPAQDERKQFHPVVEEPLQSTRLDQIDVEVRKPTDELTTEEKVEQKANETHS